MGLFNISFRRSCSDAVSRHLNINSEIKRRSYEEKDNKKNKDILLHIDEPEPFRIGIDNFLATKVLAKTTNSICLLIKYTDKRNDEVMIIKWGQGINDVNCRDHISTLIACDIVNVPRYRLKEVFKHYDTYVSIKIRTYIKGQTLQSVYDSLTDEDIDAIFVQVQAIMWLLSRKTSKYFGHINNGSFKSLSPISYIRTNAFFDRLNGTLNDTDWIEQGSDNYTSKATLCHGNLSPDHIIVEGNMVVGIVGWSHADFTSEIYERVSYYFRSNPKDARCWFRKISDVTTCPDTGRPSVEFVVNVTSYIYKHTWNNSDTEKRNIINQLWRSLTTNYTQLNCLSLATEVDGDNMSLSSLSNWENFSVSTVRPN